MVAPGDKVVLTPIAPCGRCYWCLRGQPGCCVNNSAVLGGAFLDGSTGLSRGGQQVYRGLGVGGFAEYAMTGETGAVKVPDDTPLEIACVIGCAVQTGVGAVLNTAQVEPGATVLVLGLGGIGLSVVQGAGPPAPRRSSPATRSPGGARPPPPWARPTVLDPGADDVARRHPRPHRRRRRLRVRVRGGRRARRGRRGGHAGRRLDRARGRAAARGQARARPAGAVRHQREAAHGLLPRELQLAARHPPHGGHVAGRPARPRGPGHPHRRPLDEINEAFTDLAAGVGIRTVVDLALTVGTGSGRRPTLRLHRNRQRQQQCPRGWVKVPTGGSQAACTSL